MKSIVSNPLKCVPAICCLFFSFATHNAHAANKWWDNNGTSAATSGTWDTTASKWATSSTLTASTGAFANGDFPEFSAGTGTTAALTITVNSAVSCAGMATGLGGNTNTLVTFNGSGSIGISGGVQQGFFCGQATAGNFIYNVPLTGTGGIIQKGSGYMAFYANNSFSGGLTTTGGQLLYYNTNNSFGTGVITNGAGGGNAFVNGSGNTATITIANPIVFATGAANFNFACGNPVAGAPGTTFTGNIQVPPAGEVLVLNTGGSGTPGYLIRFSGVVSGGAALTIADFGTLELGGVNTFTGGLTISSPAALSLVGSGQLNSGSYSGAITNNSAFTNSTSANQTLSGIISGAGKLTQSGSGTLTLTGVNTYTGATEITSGTLAITKASGLGTTAAGTTVTAGGALNLSGTITFNAEALTLNGTGVSSGGALRNTANNNTFPGAITLGSTGVRINSDSGTLTLSGAIGGSGKNVTFGGAANISISSVIGTGTGTVTKDGAGKLTLSATNTYTGSTTISAGTLALASTALINSTPTISIAPGATYDVSAITTYTLAGNTVMNGNGNGTAATIKGGTTVSLDNNSVILNFTPTGFLGDTTHPSLTISQGALTLNGNAFTVTNLSGTALGAGTYTLISVTGGTINGTPNASVTVKGTATLVAGATASLSVSGGNVNMVVKEAPAFSNLSASQSTSYGTPITLSGTVSATGPVYAASGETITVTINGNAQTTTINDATGDFSFSYDPGTTPASATPYTITYSYGGDALLQTASDNSTALTVNAVIATASNPTPSSPTLDAGQSVIFSVSQTSGSPVSYQWKRGANVILANGANANAATVSGSASSSLTLGRVFAADADSYFCVLHNLAGDASSGTSALTVNDPVITNQPVATLSANAGSSPTLSVSAVGTTNLVYQWKKNGGNIDSTVNSSATNATLTLSNVTDADAASYTVGVTNALGSGLLSTGTILSIIDPSAVTINTITTTVVNLTNVVFSAAVIGDSATYQWSTNSVNLNDSEHYAGTATTNLTVINATAADLGSYTIIASALGGTATNSASIDAPGFNLQPAAQTVACGQDVTFTSHANGTDPVTYQWYAGVSAIANETNAALVLHGMTLTASGNSYSVVATSPYGTASSAPAVLTVNDTNPPVITIIGPNPAMVECHSNYVDAGATASDACEGTVSVTVSGSVNTNATGSYTISYVSSDSSGNSATNTRVVNVVDTTAPVIAVSGTNHATVECHTSYVDAGATASDACAGPVPVSISGIVDTNTPGSYTLTYSATDGTQSSTATRVVQVVDMTKPAITVTGGNPYNLTAHTTFTDPGATATDTCAGNRSVTTSGTVDRDTVGTYTLTYLADDGNGNTNSATRVVNVQPLTLSVLRGTTNVTLNWSGTYTLQAATDVPMVWQDVFTGTGPYTTRTTNNQTYYRLKK